MLYCTVCDYNNGDCEIHNTMDKWGIQHQTYKYKRKPYEKDYGPFIDMIQINVFYVDVVLKHVKMLKLMKQYE